MAGSAAPTSSDDHTNRRLSKAHELTLQPDRSMGPATTGRGLLLHHEPRRIVGPMPQRLWCQIAIPGSPSCRQENASWATAN